MNDARGWNYYYYYYRLQCIELHCGEQLCGYVSPLRPDHELQDRVIALRPAESGKSVLHVA